MAKIYEFPKDRRLVRDARGILRPAPAPALQVVVEASYHEAAIAEERARKR
jgi:hypothetical protein